MKPLLLVLLLCAPIVAFTVSAQAASKQASPKQCQKWQQQLEKVNAKLRSGYTTEQGNKLRKRRRDLQSKIYRRCK